MNMAMIKDLLRELKKELLEQRAILEELKNQYAVNKPVQEAEQPKMTAAERMQHARSFKKDPVNTGKE